MTLNGAIKQLHELRSAEDMPIYYKPAIAEVINVLLMDTQEVRHGHWTREILGRSGWTTVMYQCSVCESIATSKYRYCPNCGARVDDVNPDPQLAALEKELKDETCATCKHLDFSDFYGECELELKIVQPWTTCKNWESKR